MIYYFIILLIMALLFTTLLLRSASYKGNEVIKIYQSYDILRNSLLKYRTITNFSSAQVEFNDYVLIKIKDNQVYEYPGYMPYFQKLNNAVFVYHQKTLFLEFYYQGIKYKQVIFYEK